MTPEEIAKAVMSKWYAGPTLAKHVGLVAPAIRAALQERDAALRALLDNDCYDHADMCCADWCGMCRDEAAARKNARALLEEAGK